MNLPTVSFLLLAYEHETFVADAVRSVLAQDYQPLEVILSDDASSDRTFEIIEKVAAAYDGPHTVVLNRNGENLGEPEHIGKLARSARGRILVTGHGDDLAMPQRTHRLVECLTQHDVSMVSSNAEMMDVEMNTLGLVSKITTSRNVSFDAMLGGWNSMMLGATLAFDRAVCERFPALTRRTLPLGGWDHVGPFRAVLLKGMYYVAEPLIRYRQHGENLGANIADRTSGKHAYAETMRVHDINALVHRLADVMHFRREGPDSSHLKTVQQKLQHQILKKTMRWTQFRNQMILGGQRPTWVDKSTLAAKSTQDDLRFKPEVPSNGILQPPSEAAEPDDRDPDERGSQ